MTLGVGKAPANLNLQVQLPKDHFRRRQQGSIKPPVPNPFGNVNPSLPCCPDAMDRSGPSEDALPLGRAYLGDNMRLLSFGGGVGGELPSKEPTRRIKTKTTPLPEREKNKHRLNTALFRKKKIVCFQSVSELHRLDLGREIRRWRWVDSFLHCERSPGF